LDDQTTDIKTVQFTASSTVETPGQKPEDTSSRNKDCAKIEMFGTRV
jgi:hypothetical protein